MLIEIHTFSYKKIHLKMSPGKWRQFCFGLNVLTTEMFRTRCPGTHITNDHEGYPDKTYFVISDKTVGSGRNFHMLLQLNCMPRTAARYMFISVTESTWLLICTNIPKYSYKNAMLIKLMANATIKLSVCKILQYTFRIWFIISGASLRKVTDGSHFIFKLGNGFNKLLHIHNVFLGMDACHGQSFHIHPISISRQQVDHLMELHLMGGPTICSQQIVFFLLLCMYTVCIYLHVLQVLRRHTMIKLIP